MNHGADAWLAPSNAVTFGWSGVHFSLPGGAFLHALGSLAERSENLGVL